MAIVLLSLRVIIKFTMPLYWKSWVFSFEDRIVPLDAWHLLVSQNSLWSGYILGRFTKGNSDSLGARCDLRYPNSFWWQLCPQHEVLELTMKTRSIYCCVTNCSRRFLSHGLCESDSGAAVGPGLMACSWGWGPDWLAWRCDGGRGSAPGWLGYACRGGANVLARGLICTRWCLRGPESPPGHSAVSLGRERGGWEREGVCLSRLPPRLASFPWSRSQAWSAQLWCHGCILQSP